MTAAVLSIGGQLQIPLREFRFSFARSSGPGGQNVNKVNTKALLHWDVLRSPSLSEAVRARLVAQCRTRINADGELLVVGQRFRDAGRNVADCLERLRQMLLAAARPPRVRKPTRATRGSVRRRLETKRRRAERKQSRRTGVGSG